MYDHIYTCITFRVPGTCILINVIKISHEVLKKGRSTTNIMMKQWKKFFMIIGTSVFTFFDSIEEFEFFNSPDLERIL